MFEAGKKYRIKNFETSTSALEYECVYAWDNGKLGLIKGSNDQHYTANIRYYEPVVEEVVEKLLIKDNGYYTSDVEYRDDFKHGQVIGEFKIHIKNDKIDKITIVNSDSDE